MLGVDEVIPDRIIPGENGGTYRRSNIRGPHCTTCSCRQGQRRSWELRLLNDPYDVRDCCRRCGVHYLASHAASCETGQLEAGPAGW